MFTAILREFFRGRRSVSCNSDQKFNFLGRNPVSQLQNTSIFSVLNNSSCSWKFQPQNTTLFNMIQPRPLSSSFVTANLTYLLPKAKHLAQDSQPLSTARQYFLVSKHDSALVASKTRSLLAPQDDGQDDEVAESLTI